jgi:hypothetical protein
MTDDAHTPPGTPDFDDRDARDERDEHLAALLAVEPLDDVTRRRLVNTAMQSTRTHHARRLVAVAAAIFVVLVAGAVVVGLRTTGSSTKTAARAPSAAGTGTPQKGNGEPALAPAIADAGDFGDLGVAANRSQLFARYPASTGAATASAVPAPSAGSSNFSSSAGSPLTADTDALTARLHALSCRDELPAGTVVALGTGQLNGKNAIVVVTRAADGSYSFHAVTASPCTVTVLS